MQNEARKVKNPYIGNDQYHCFACDPENSYGLNLEFYLEDDTLVSYWTPRPHFEGYPGVVHGGILATLADEVAGWFLHAVEGKAGVTSELSVTYKTPARCEEGPFRISGKRGKVDGKYIAIDVIIRNANGSELCSAECVYATFSDAVARKRLHFPGRSAFIPDE